MPSLRTLVAEWLWCKRSLLRQWLLLPIFSLLLWVPALCLCPATHLSAQTLPIATVALDAAHSDCESGRLLVTADGISGGRQYWRATWSDSTHQDVPLGESEDSGPVGSYNGPIDFPFLAGPVPFGIIVTLYGYLGSTPPDPRTTVEFSVTYVCDTQEVLTRVAGFYGVISAPPKWNIPSLGLPGLLALIALVLASAAWLLQSAKARAPGAAGGRDATLREPGRR